MVTAGVNIKFTYEDYCNAPEDKRYELIDGDLVVVPAPKEEHQDSVGAIFIALALFVRERMLGRVYVAPFDVLFTNTDVVQPDVIFVSNERLNIITPDNIQGAPDLLIEVLSPSTALRDRTFKRALYARYGVKEFWLVNTDEKTIEVLLLGERDFETYAVFGPGQTLTSPTLTDFTLDIDEIF